MISFIIKLIIYYNLWKGKDENGYHLISWWNDISGDGGGWQAPGSGDEVRKVGIDAPAGAEFTEIILGPKDGRHDGH